MATHLPPGLSPDAFDAVTELTSIVVRLRASQQQDSATSGGAGGPTSTPAAAGAASGGLNPSGTTPLPATNAANTPSGAQQPPTSATAVAGATANSNDHNNNTTTTTTTTTTTSALPPLSLKDLPAATDPLRHKLQRARAAVRALADVQRGLAQQEAELAGLEARRRAQAERLAKAQEDGLQFVKCEGEKGERMVEGE
ncbi:hypothetical protein VTJ83DRAFT_3181 [Remersonia thermophila]|uniref:Mediator of RNA polymerase II transcription subunit 9 n=1 Tax=Remersonia thermophila TaxID=72144 RepID=A0ABR4DDY9_9PEZI